MMKLKLLAVAVVGLASVAYAQEASAPEELSWNGDTIYGVRTLPDYDVTGTYLYEGGDPKVVLNADGSGCFATHGMPCRSLNWWLMADQDGTVKTEKGPAGQRHVLIFRFDDGSVDGNDLGISYTDRKMYILGERVKDF